MPETIRAAVCRDFNAPLSIETVTLADPGPGEVKVAVKACAICHSDIIYAEGGWGGELPMVLGHEAAGIVEAVGPGVDGVAPGDHVVVTLIRSCGSCHYCSGGHQVLCEEVFPLDETIAAFERKRKAMVHGLRTGAFAEKVVVEKSQVAVIPKDIAFEPASLLACGVITGFGAVTNTAQIPEGSHVAVIGCGGVGLNAVQGALAAGAKTITAIDLSDDKLEAAKRFGATLRAQSDRSRASRRGDGGDRRKRRRFRLRHRRGETGDRRRLAIHHQERVPSSSSACRRRA
jgi:S-(hydroxymethyl)glutathione dehydrogenase/alcohol dehydrogenase